MALIQPTSSQGQELNTNPAKRRFVEILHERDARQAQRLFYALFPEANTPWSGPPILGGGGGTLVTVLYRIDCCG